MHLMNLCSLDFLLLFLFNYIQSCVCVFISGLDLNTTNKSVTTHMVDINEGLGHVTHTQASAAFIGWQLIESQ